MAHPKHPAYCMHVCVTLRYARRCPAASCGWYILTLSRAHPNHFVGCMPHMRHVRVYDSVQGAVQLPAVAAVVARAAHSPRHILSTLLAL
jgi:hypothetical protein